MAGRKKKKRKAGKGAGGRRRLALRLGLGLVAGLTIFAIWLGAYALTPMPARETPELPVLIPSGTGLPGIGKILAARQIIPPGPGFYLLARLSGLSKRLQAGEYLFKPGQSPYQVLGVLAKGETVRWAVTIPEGSNVYQTAEILAQGGWGEREEFLRLMRDPELRARYEIRAASLEGYLFPDTYQLSRIQTPQEIIGLMLEKGRRVRLELGVLDNGHGLSPHQVITLASIVEKETADPAERPLIARVFLNRLKIGMRLQTDPTVIYGLRDFNGNLTRKDLETPGPYNTYLNAGLPPGPITNPGRAAIAAVLEPAPDDYLYFVSKNDGTHQFSRDLTEHNQAVARYQKSGRSRPEEKIRIR